LAIIHELAGTHFQRIGAKISIIVQEYHGFLPVGELNNYVFTEGEA